MVASLSGIEWTMVPSQPDRRETAKSASFIGVFGLSVAACRALPNSRLCESKAARRLEKSSRSVCLHTTRDSN